MDERDILRSPRWWIAVYSFLSGLIVGLMIR